MTPTRRRSGMMTRPRPNAPLVHNTKSANKEEPRMEHGSNPDKIKPASFALPLSVFFGVTSVALLWEVRIMPDGFTTRPVYMGTHGVICSGHYLAARAGQRMFDKGGNAIDAAVASGYALNLLEPQNNGLGGEVPILVYSAKEKKPFAISGQGFIGEKATVDWFRKAGIDKIPGDGFLPACVPAAFASWATALMRFGTLTLKAVLEPVIDYAPPGFPVYPSLRAALTRLR